MVKARNQAAATCKESELYAPLKCYFEALGYNVKGEVRHCDMVAVKVDVPEAEPIIIELKSSFNVTLLLQAMERLKLSSYVYVAVVKKKTNGNSHSIPALRHLCERLGLGFLLVTFYKHKKPFVEAICHPLNDSRQAGHMYKPVKSVKTKLMHEFNARSGDYNTGGITKQPLITAYREKTLRVAVQLHEGPQRAFIIRSKSGVGDTTAILQRNYYGWFERQSRGIYALTEKGAAALVEYTDIIMQLPHML